MASAQEMLAAQNQPFGEFGTQATASAMGGGGGGGGTDWKGAAAQIGAGFLGGGGGSLDMGSGVEGGNITDRSVTDLSGPGITMNRPPAQPAGPAVAGMGGSAMEMVPWLAMGAAVVYAFANK